jgi:hypothetical protein
MNTRAKSDIDKNLPVDIEEPIQLFIKQLDKEKIEMDEYLKSMKKPKKKQVDKDRPLSCSSINAIACKTKLKKDLFELDFMCE